MLIGFDMTFSIRVGFSVELLVGSTTIAAVMFSGSLVGFSPTVLSGKAEIKFLFLSISVKGSLTLHEGGGVDPDIDITGTLVSAISQPTNWEAGSAAGLVLTDVKREGVWVSPNA